MELNYEKGLGKSLIKIQADEEFVESFEYRMLEENEIPLLISPRKLYENGKWILTYDVSGYESIASLVCKKEISKDILDSLIVSFIDLGEKLKEYLLSEKGVLITENTVFYNALDDRFLFLYCGEFLADFSESLTSFFEFIINNIDHKDEEAVKVSYELYERILCEDYSFKNLVDRKIETNILQNENEIDEKMYRQSPDGEYTSKKSNDDIYYEEIKRLTEKTKSKPSILPVIIIMVLIYLGYLTKENIRFFSIVAIALAVVICITIFSVINDVNMKKRRRMISMLSELSHNE
ncbi:MAG: DUF6382 domain-containing protein [Lachnospiraceae bacterium]|nr:DUF6382 domain-containing protein [Lachnospiraceae bacterium]